MRKTDENFYQLLKVHPKATVAEIVSAYHTARNAFSKDSLATYSLFSPDEVKEELDKLEEAYMTLSNIEKRIDYDKKLASLQEGESMPPAMTELEKKQNAQWLPKEQTSTETTPVPSASVSSPVAEFLNDVDLATLSGAQLRECREKRQLSLEDVSRITKIPARFLSAIEADDFENMPARVYVQGFVKNMSNLYKLDPAITVKAYLSFFDERKKAS